MRPLGWGLLYICYLVSKLCRTVAVVWTPSPPCSVHRIFSKTGVLIKRLRGHRQAQGVRMRARGESSLQRPALQTLHLEHPACRGCILSPRSMYSS